FGFDSLPAVILNKATSIVVVASSILFRARSVPLTELLGRGGIILTLLSGSLLGAWLGAGWATRMGSRTLSRTLSVLLVGIAALLVFVHDVGAPAEVPSLTPRAVALGVVAGFGIGVVTSVMGVAGGELLIPTLVLLFRLNMKTAGSLSLVVSLPTMIVGFARYSRDRAFQIVREERGFLAWMALGSVAGAFVGGRLIGLVPDSILRPLLSLILVRSAG